MSLKMKVDIAVSICSLVISATSIVLVILSILQNNKILENATRPYICVYGQLVNLGGIHFYIVIKNFGASPATITKFETTPDLTDCHLETLSQRMHLREIAQSTIAPGRSRICLLDFSKIPNEDIKFKIKYRSSRKKYTEKFSTNIKAGTDMLNVKYGDNIETDIHAISYVLQEILQREL